MAPIGKIPAPYPGIRPFEPHEAAIFCGRERTTLEVIARLGERNLVLVHGGSGCGKSSLVRAGVLPTIDRDHTLAKRRFEYAIMRPSEGPLTALDRILTQTLGPTPGGWAQSLIFPDQIVAQIEDACEKLDIETFCVVIDQFEESFRWARENSRSDIQLLTNFLEKVSRSDSGGRFFVLITMRSDYLSDCAQFPGLSDVINECQYFLPNLDQRGLLRSIAEPARLFNGFIDDALINKLCFAASESRDPLPTMQHSLMRMSQQKRSKVARGAPWTLKLTDYDVLQEGNGALSNHADELFVTASGDRPEIVEGLDWFFRALIDLDVGGRGIRRPCAIAELQAVSGLSERELFKTIDLFSAEGANLLVLSKPTTIPSEWRVDISHEALIRNWRRMTGDGQEEGWLALELNDALIWRTLAVAARVPGSTLDGVTLEEREQWLEPFFRQPERARRYLLKGHDKPKIEDEPEWQSVGALIARSQAARDAQMEERESAERSRRNMRLSIIALCLALSTICALLLWRNVRDTAAKEKTEKELISKEIDSLVKSQDSSRSGARAGQDTVSSAALKQIAPLLNVATSGQTTDGFMWIGSDRIKYLLTETGEEVAPREVKVNKRYRTADNIVLRVGPPGPGNDLQEAVNIVPQGSMLVVQSAPVVSVGKNGRQYWVEVRQIVPPVTEASPVTLTVVPQYTNAAEGRVAQISQGLERLGYKVLPFEKLPQAKNRREIRFCHDEDQARAIELAAKITQLLRSADPLPAKKLQVECSKTPKQMVELWIGEL